jgi:UDP-glucose 4-epimerase
MKYVITGGSGYIGTALTEFLVGRQDTELVAIADVRPPRYPRAKTQFHRTDVRDRAAVRALLEKIQPDALVHLAFMVNPMRDEATMYDIDVNGTLFVLDAASAAGTPHVLVTSSTTAYGAWPDNPEPISEEHILRGQPDFAYARHKTEADRLCGLWAAEHPDRTMTIVRPCIVFGPNVDNYIVRFYENAPFLPRFRGEPDRNVQFIHEDDVAEAISGLLIGRHAGAYNATGDGVMTWQESAELAQRKVRTIPFGLAYRMNAMQWRLKMRGVESPPGNLAFIRYPWVCSNRKLKETLGWQPRHDSRETFLQTMRARGVIPPAPGAEARQLSSLKSANGADSEEPVAGPAGRE